MRAAASAAIATSQSAGSGDRSSNNCCDSRMPGMLRTRSSWKSTFAATRSACNRRSVEKRCALTERPSALRASWPIRARGGPSRSFTALEVEVAAQRKQPLESVLEDHVDGTTAEAAVRLRHPAIGEVAIVRKQDAQRLVDA